MSPRPTTLQEIALRSASIGDFGRHLRDWLHELRRASSRPQAALTITAEPPRLRDKFPHGQVADAWLAPFLSPLIGAASVGLIAWWFLYAEEAQRKLIVVLLCAPFFWAIVYSSGRHLEQARNFSTYYVLIRPAGWIPLTLAGLFSGAMLFRKFRPTHGLIVCLVVFILALMLSLHFESTKGPIAGYGG